MHFEIPDRSGIYAICRVADGKAYVGSSVNMRKRVYEHLRLLTHGRHKNAHLQAAFTKHGSDAFCVVVLRFVENANDLYAVEQWHLDVLQTCDPARGYNRASDTTAPQRGLKRSDETKAKIGASKRGNTNRLGIGFSDEAKRKIAESLRGFKHSAATKAKLSAIKKGVRKSPEWCAKMSAIQKGRIVTQAQRAKISATLKARARAQKSE